MTRDDEIEAVKRTSAQIAPLLDGLPPAVQSAILADLLATWLAGHAPGDVKAVLNSHLKTVALLVPINFVLHVEPKRDERLDQRARGLTGRRADAASPRGERADRDEAPEPCTSEAIAAGCTCRMSPVNSASIDPPEPIIDGWCPLHGGRNPDDERDALLERQAEAHAHRWNDRAMIDQVNAELRALLAELDAEVERARRSDRSRPRAESAEMSEHKMRMHPFDDVIANARKRMAEGWTVHLQFNCAYCGTKQTFAEENYLAATGRCEECGRITSLQTNGCNFMVHKGAGGT